MKIREVIMKKKEYYLNCQKCGKEMKGSSESQVLFILDVHKKSKNCRVQK